MVERGQYGSRSGLHGLQNRGHRVGGSRARLGALAAARSATLRAARGGRHSGERRHRRGSALRSRRRFRRGARRGGAVGEARPGGGRTGGAAGRGPRRPAGARARALLRAHGRGCPHRGVQGVREGRHGARRSADRGGRRLRRSGGGQGARARRLRGEAGRPRGGQGRHRLRRRGRGEARDRRAVDDRRARRRSRAAAGGGAAGRSGAVRHRAHRRLRGAAARSRPRPQAARGRGPRPEHGRDGRSEPAARRDARGDRRGGPHRPATDGARAGGARNAVPRRPLCRVDAHAARPARPRIQLPPGRPRGAGHPAAAAQRSAPAAPRQRAGRPRRPGALVGPAHRGGGGDRRLRISGHPARRRRGGRPARCAAVRRSLGPARGDQGEGGQGGDRGRARAHRRGPGRRSGRGTRSRLPGRRAHPHRGVADATRHRRRGGGVSEARAELPVPESVRVAARRGSPGGARPFGQLDRLLSLKFLQLFAATLGGVVLLYLTVDFADRAGSFWGRAWGKAALELYWNKAAVVAYQLAPAALIIAAALLATLLARRGELTALFALGVRPWRLAAPVAAVTALLGVLLFQLGERVVVRADARAEEIQVKRFNRWGDWATYHAGASWLRGENGRIYHLGPPRDGGWEPATVLEIAQPFRLARRIDARRLEPAGPGRWRFLDAVETRYALSAEPGGIVAEVRAAVLEERFPETAAALELRSGRPRQLSWKQLREQAERRA